LPGDYIDIFGYRHGQENLNVDDLSFHVNTDLYSSMVAPIYIDRSQGIILPKLVGKFAVTSINQQQCFDDNPRKSFGDSLSDSQNIQTTPASLEPGRRVIAGLLHVGPWH
jgi:hypothetical protein